MQIPIKNKQGKTVDIKYRLNPAFERVLIVAKNSNKAVSEMLKVKDDYCAFCIDEAALYINSKMYKPVEKSGNDILKKLSKRK